MSLAGDTNLAGTTGTFAQGITGNNNSLLLNFSQPTALGGLFSNLADFTSLGDVTVNGTISTNVDQNYAANVTLTGDGTFTGNAASFNGAVVGGNHDLTINFTGGSTTLDGLFTNVATLNALSAVDIGANIQTNADQNYGSTVNLTADVTLSGNAGSFSGLISGNNNDLTLNFTGGQTTINAAYFSNFLSQIQNLTSLGPVELVATALTPALTTAGQQRFEGNVVLGTNVTLQPSDLTINGSVEGTTSGNQSLEVSAVGSVTFRGNVGQQTRLGNLTLASTSASLRSVSTTGDQEYGSTSTSLNGTYDAGGSDKVVNGTVTLAGNTAIHAAADVFFAKAIQGTTDGGQTLVINGSGNTTLGDTVGTASVALASINITGGGQVTLGGDVTTTGEQQFGEQVVLSADVDFNATGGGNITFDGAVDGTAAGSQALAATTTGNVTFNGTVGGATSLAGINVTGSQITLVSNATTAGDQTYSGQLSLNGSYTTGTGNFTQLVGCGTQLAGNTTIDTGSGNVTLAIVNPTTANVTSLTIDTTGSTVLGTVGAGGRLASINITGGTATLSGVATSGEQTYGGDVVLTTPGTSYSTLNSAITVEGTTQLTAGNLATFEVGSGNVTFNGTVNGLSSLVVNSTGTTTFSGAVGGVLPLSSLTTDAGGTTVLGGDVTTTGNQNFGDQVNMTGSVTLVSGAGTIDASSGINGTGQTLTIGDAGQTGGVTLGGNIVLGGLATGTGAFDLGINVGLNQTAVVGGATTLQNNGTLTLQSTASQSADSYLDFTGGLNATAVEQTVLSGYLLAQNAPISLNNVAVAGTGGAIVTTGSLTDPYNGSGGDIAINGLDMQGLNLTTLAGTNGSTILTAATNLSAGTLNTLSGNLALGSGGTGATLTATAEANLAVAANYAISIDANTTLSAVGQTV
ncbi:MAG: hypothetical protein EBS83_12595, partial [Planctomycetia bacterium]|nr:hypothetical protein [Planctomycetia bacterium]